jgi:hypothetical protein
MTKKITKVCTRCGQSFETNNRRLRVCPTCRARSRRGRRNDGGGGRRTFSAAGVLARSAPPGGHGGAGGGTISVNTSFYRDRQPDDGMPSVVVLRGDEDGALVAMRGDNGWVKPACPDLTVDRFAGYLAEHCGYALADRDGQEVILTRDSAWEVSHA